MQINTMQWNLHNKHNFVSKTRGQLPMKNYFTILTKGHMHKTNKQAKSWEWFLSFIPTLLFLFASFQSCLLYSKGLLDVHDLRAEFQPTSPGPRSVPTNCRSADCTPGCEICRAYWSCFHLGWGRAVRTEYLRSGQIVADNFEKLSTQK